MILSALQSIILRDHIVTQGRRIVAAEGGSKTAVLAPNVVNEGSRAGEATDSMDDSDRVH
jgi:hypothetical protein